MSTIYVYGRVQKFRDILSTCHEPGDKSVKTDLQVIMYELRAHNVSWVTLITGKLYPDDPVTKRNSHVVKQHQLFMFRGEITIGIIESKSRNSFLSTG